MKTSRPAVDRAGRVLRVAQEVDGRSSAGRGLREGPVETGLVGDVGAEGGRGARGAGQLRPGVGPGVDGTIARHSRLDAVVNNAGIGGPSDTVAEMDPDDFERVLAVNLVGPFLLCRVGPGARFGGSSPASRRA